MKVTYTTPSGRTRIEFEHEQIEEAFEALAAVGEVLDAETACGLCQSKEIRHLVRHVPGQKGKVWDYYELECTRCGGRFAFGQLTSGGLFPKRRDADGNPLPKRGWALPPRGQRDDAQEPAAESPPASPAPAASPPRFDREKNWATIEDAFAARGLPATQAAFEGALKRMVNQGHPWASKIVNAGQMNEDQLAATVTWIAAAPLVGCQVGTRQ